MTLDISLDKDKRNSNFGSGIFEVDYKYEYPRELDLKPGSPLHKEIVTKIMTYAQESHWEMKNRYDSWAAVDKTLTAFVSPETLTRAKMDKTVDIPVVVPITYATMETLLTYMTSVFLTDIIFKYAGADGSPEAALGAAQLEHIISIHCVKRRVGLALHTMWRDMFAYGAGVVSPTWFVKEGRQTVVEKEGFYDYLGKFVPLPSKAKRGERRILFEGNQLENVDPYCWLPDPHVSACDIQKGEFCGWVVRTNKPSLLTEEVVGNGDIFNVKYLEHTSGKSMIMGEAKAERWRSTSDKGRGSEPIASSTKPYDVIYMYVNLIPEEWGLGKGDYPEKWLFGLAAEEVIIQARPVELDHDDYPVTSCASTSDGYSSTPISHLEVFNGLQSTLDWFFTSHVANVRKAVNDMIVYDPQLIYSRDLRQPGSGKLIRTRKAAWGKGIDNAIKQLEVKDVTRNHIADAGFIMEIIQRVSAATDPLQGIMRSGGERRSATEARDTRMGAISKMEKMAKMISMQAMTDIANFFALHTQQLMSEETYVEIAEDWEKKLRDEFGLSGRRYKVAAEDLIIDYKVVAHDGTMPGGEYVDSWVLLYQTLAKSPELAQQFDMVRIFKHIARKMGAKDLSGFEVKTKVEPTEDVLREEERGNLIPIEGEEPELF